MQEWNCRLHTLISGWLIVHWIISCTCLQINEISMPYNNKFCSNNHSIFYFLFIQEWIVFCWDRSQPQQAEQRKSSETFKFTHGREKWPCVSSLSPIHEHARLWCHCFTLLSFQQNRWSRCQQLLNPNILNGWMGHLNVQKSLLYFISEAAKQSKGLLS